MTATPAPVSSSQEFTGALFEDTLGRAARGEPRALTELLRSIGPLITQYCRAHHALSGRSCPPADDLARDVCAEVVAALPAYRPQHQHFLAFTYTITARTVSAAAHSSTGRGPATARHRISPRHELPGTRAGADRSATPTAPPAIAPTTAAMLAALPPEQREILILRVASGLSTEHTAHAVGLTPAAVRVLQHRALARLRTALADTPSMNGGG